MEPVTLIGKWHLVADTVLTFSRGALIKTDYNTNTKASLSDLEFALGQMLYLYNNETYEIQPTYDSAGSSVTLNLPASTGGTAAKTKTASIKVLTAGRLLLYFPPVSTNGTSSTMDFVKLSTQ